MTIPERFTSERGATRLGFLDVLAALILLGVLLVVAYFQFPTYEQPASPSLAPSAGAPSAPK